MTERRDTQSAETTHSVWEALPHATVRYQTVCSAVKDNPEVPCTYGLACLTECQGACRRIVLRTSPPAGTMSCAWPASLTAWACPRCTSGTRCWTASTGEGGLGAPPGLSAPNRPPHWELYFKGSARPLYTGGLAFLLGRGALL